MLLVSSDESFISFSLPITAYLTCASFYLWLANLHQLEYTRPHPDYSHKRKDNPENHSFGFLLNLVYRSMKRNTDGCKPIDGSLHYVSLPYIDAAGWKVKLSIIRPSGVVAYAASCARLQRHWNIFVMLALLSIIFCTFHSSCWSLLISFRESWAYNSKLQQELWG